MLLWGTFPRSSMVVVILPRDMGGIPVRLHLLPRASVMRACCTTLLCHRRITVPPLAWTSQCPSPALVADHLRRHCLFCKCLRCMLPLPPPGPHILLVPAILSTPTTKVLKLNDIKDAKAFLDSLDIIKFCLCEPKFSSGLPDSALVTTPSNLEASCLWEGQLRLAEKDGDLRSLLENKGTLFNGCGFEMHAALTAYCRPDSVAIAFSSLLSLFNKIQGEDKPMSAFRSCFDSLILEMACCKVAIPPLLLVMLFLRALHSCYAGYIEQFRTRHHAIKTRYIH
jgi:hypothetical protein